VDPGTLVYIEVPREPPFGFFTLAKRAAQQAILMLKRPQVARQLFLHNFLVQMHEHVNFFETRSLNSLVDSQKWEVLKSGSYDVDVYRFGFLKLPASRQAWCLAQVSTRAALERGAEAATIA